MHGCETWLSYSRWQSSQWLQYSQDSSFQQNCEFFPMTFFLASVCHVLSVIFYASLVFEWVLAAVPTWAVFSSLWNILWLKDSTAPCYVSCSTHHQQQTKVKYKCILCLVGSSTVCLGHLLSTSAESVAYVCSLLLHVVSVPWWIKIGLRARWLFWELVVARKIGTLAICEKAVSLGLHCPAVTLHKFLA